MTLTLHESKHNHHHHANNENEGSKSKVPQPCYLCKFEFLPQSSVTEPRLQEQITFAEGNLTSNLSNVWMAAKTISSAFEALGLLIYSLGELPGESKKDVQLTYHRIKEAYRNGSSSISSEVIDLLNKEYLTISCEGAHLSKR